MNYLYRPNANEELSVQGSYTVAREDGTPLAREAWERWRTANGEAEIWRAEWRDAAGAHGMLAHALVSAEGAARLKVRITGREPPAPTLSLTIEEDGVLVSQGGIFEEVALPPVYGLVTPFLSMARLGLPFDIGVDDRQLAMTYLLRPQWQDGTWSHRPTKFAFLPLGFRDIEARGVTVKGKGWRMEVPGLPARSLWFDRHGTLLAAEITDSPLQVVTLESYRTYG